jgi:catechol 2,3-dioxygenase-like lactoylglutathione lyase family enzyme
MQVKGLDHVNIVTADLDGTAGFYQALLGLRPERTPNAPAGFDGRWLYDTADRPIIHLMAYDPKRHGLRTEAPATTGSIDHVALACEDFAGMLRRCESLEVEHRVNDRKYGSLRQIFVTDPNNVVLELNFHAD